MIVSKIRTIAFTLLAIAIVFMAIQGIEMFSHTRLFDPYMPHGFCLMFDKYIIIPSIYGDIATFLAYMFIPYKLYKVLKLFGSYDPKILYVAKWFIVFILACGFGHLFQTIQLYQTNWLGINSYYFTAFWKALTGTVSIYTAYILTTSIINFVNKNKITKSTLHESISSLMNGLDNMRKTVSSLNILESFPNQELSVYKWDEIIKTEFDVWNVSENKGFRTKRIFDSEKEYLMVAEVDPNLSDRDYSYFGLQKYDCKKVGVVVYGNRIEKVEFDKEYVEDDTFRYPIGFIHNPISTIKSKYIIELINPNK